MPAKSGRPPGSRGAGAVKSGSPDGLRGMVLAGTSSHHCASAAAAANATAIDKAITRNEFGIRPLPLNGPAKHYGLSAPHVKGVEGDVRRGSRTGFWHEACCGRRDAPTWAPPPHGGVEHPMA